MDFIANNPKKLSEFKLYNGQTIPSIGYGTGLLIEGCEEAITLAIEAGYRHIDTARFYGNEKLIGNTIASLIKQGKILRSDLFITTKVWNNIDSDAEKDLRAALNDLQTDYVDLCLIHWPFGSIDENFVMKQHPLHIYWKQLEGCAEKGLTKSIGVSNFSCQILCDLLSYAKIKPAVNQIENHPYLPQDHLVKFCHRYNIHVTSYCPLARGGPTKNPIFKGDNPEIFEEPIVMELAKKYNKTIAQIILNFGLSRGNSVLTKSVKMERMKESLGSQNFVMEQSDIEKLSSLNRNARKHVSFFVLDQLSDQKFEEDSQIHDFESSSFIINNSDFKTKNFQYLQSFPKSNAIISAQPLETEKFLHFIRLTPFEISFLSRKNQDLENPLPLHSLKDIIQDFFYNPILSQDNLRKSAIFLIETLLEKKLSLSQAYSQNEELWETSKSDFLKKNANYKSEQKISSEIKSMLEYFENLLKKAVELSTIFYELLNIVKNYTNNELILKISENKQISIEKVLFLMQNLKNNNHNDKKYTISIRTQTKEVLNNLRVELELFEGQFKSSNQKHKAFFLLIQESYHELFQLQEIFVKRLQILRTHLFSAQSACNLILLPFTSDYHSNNTNLESSYKILKNVEHKLLKFKTKIKQIQIHSSFFQHLKHHIKYNLKLTIQSLEIETDRVLAQTKLLFEFPRIESDIKSLHSHLSIHNYSSNPFSLDFGRKFYCKMVQVRLFSELLRKQTKPLTVLLSFQAFLETNLKILIINYDGCKNQLKERQREELQKIGSLRKEAETCSQKIQIYLEKNLLSPEERYFLKQNVNSLIETFETLSNCTEITDNASSQIVSLKTQLQKDIVSMDCFEEMLKSISLQISFPSLKPLLNGLKISSKINLFNPFLKKLEKYCNHLSPIPSLYRPIKELLARIITLLPCLKYFQSLYEEYVEKFTTFSSDYEALKEEIWNMRPALLAKIASLSSNKEDKSFFISIGEQFIVALKKHYEVLTPENILYLHNESKHMLLEIESRINFFYSNSENLNSMAISNNRQLRLKNTMNLFFHIIDKLKLSNTQSFLEENNLIFIETEEILHRCKGFVNSLLKISQMAVLIIEKGLQPYKQKLGTIERFNCMKEFLNELREGKRGLTLEKTQVIDEQIKSLYIYLLDDIGSLNLYLEKLVPNIEKFIHYKEFFEERKNTFLGDQNFLLNLKGFLNFHRDINNNPNTHKKKLFYENSSINDIIQSTYALWFEEIMTFFTNFNLNWLEKLYICLNILNKNPLKSLMIETIEFVDEFLLKLNSNNDLITLSLFLKERITYFNEKYNNLELSVFTLETLNQRDIGSNIFFTDIELIKEDFKQTPSFYIWSECFENTRKVLDAGERVIENSEKKTFIIWKRAIAKLYFSKLEVFAQSAKLENAQKRFLEGTIEMIKKYFFTVKKKVFSKNMTEILKI